MMTCDWTSKISSLIDGELAPEESAHLQAHLLTCAACQRTQEDFFLLRRQIASYQTQTTPFAQQRALQNILASGASAASAANASTSKRLKDAHSRPGLLDSLSLIFNPRLTPARMSALALVLFAITLGLFAYLKSHNGPSRESIAQSNNAPANVTPSPLKDQESASGGMDQPVQPNNNRRENGPGGSANDARPTLAVNNIGERGRGKSLTANAFARRVERERRLPFERRLTPDTELLPGVAPDNGASGRTIALDRNFDIAPLRATLR